MPQNIFKIYDGRTNFWQWDTGQKLIVLDDSVTEVHFSNRGMEHSKKKTVYKDKDGVRVVNIPDLLLQLPKNLIAYAYAGDSNGTGRTVKSVRFAVIQRPIPVDYVCGQDDVLEDIMIRLELLEALMKDVEAGTQQLIKFADMVEAAKWAISEGVSGDIIVVKLEGKWIAHIVEDDKSLSPICDENGEEVVIYLDGDDADGIDQDETFIYYDGNHFDKKTSEKIQVFDGGNAAGI
jgi:hypothetical protein